MVVIALLTFHCDPTCLSCVDELKLINDCVSFFFVVFIINHPSIYCFSQQIYLLLRYVQTFLGGAIPNTQDTQTVVFYARTSVAEPENPFAGEGINMWPKATNVV